MNDFDFESLSEEEQSDLMNMYETETRYFDENPQRSQIDTVTLSFTFQVGSWDSKAVTQYTDMAVLLNSLRNKVFEHKHNPNADELHFWERFSQEVMRELEEYDLTDVINTIP